jgi:hypothetical protein
MSLIKTYRVYKNTVNASKSLCRSVGQVWGTPWRAALSNISSEGFLMSNSEQITKIKK